MNDVDRELKEIQLQRERLALRRELARNARYEKTIGQLPRLLASGVAGVSATFRRAWKPTAIAMAALVVHGERGDRSDPVA